MPLKATVDEHLTANAVHCRDRRKRILAEGKCAICKQPRPVDRADKSLCQPCQANEVRRRWGQTQRTLTGRRTRIESAWNYETDGLITDHIMLAKKLAWRVAHKLSSSSTVEFDDIVGDAYYGLVIAGRTFDPSKNVPFGAWATRNIRGAIYNGVKAWSHLGMKQPPVTVELRETEDGILRYRDT
jgi:hypothetical protein